MVRRPLTARSLLKLTWEWLALVIPNLKAHSDIHPYSTVIDTNNLLSYKIGLRKVVMCALMVTMVVKLDNNLESAAIAIYYAPVVHFCSSFSSWHHTRAYQKH